ncbi:hypothetical protein BH23VER1_BH23VER1_35980 [soil metagenome]
MAEPAPEPPPTSPPDAAELVSLWEDISLWDEAAVADREPHLFRALAAWLDASGPSAFGEVVAVRREALPEGLQRWLSGRGLPFLLVQIGQKDLVAATEILRRNGSSDLQRALAPLLLSEASATTLQELITGKKFDGHPSEWSRAGARLAELGDEAAAAMIRTTLDSPTFGKSFSFFPSDMNNLRLAAGYVSALATQSYDDALAFIDSLPDAAAVLLQQAALGSLFAHDPDRAQSEAIRLGRVDAVAQAMAESDLPGALDWLGEATADSDARLRLDALRTLAPKMRELPVADLVATLDRLAADTEKRLSSTVYSPAHADALGAIAHAYLAPRGLENAPALAESLAAAPASPARDELLGTALALWSLGHPEEAAARAIELVDAGNSPALATRLAFHLTRTPASAIAVAERLDEDDRPRFSRAFAEAAAEENPTATAAALAAAPDSPGAPDITRQLLSKWADDDMLAASVWLATVPAGPTKDAGIGSLVRWLAPLEPESANRWLASMSDSARQAEAIELAYFLWEADRDSARAWLETTPLDPAKKSDLLAR